MKTKSVMFTSSNQRPQRINQPSIAVLKAQVETLSHWVSNLRHREIETKAELNGVLQELKQISKHLNTYNSALYMAKRKAVK